MEARQTHNAMIGMSVLMEGMDDPMYSTPMYAQFLDITKALQAFWTMSWSRGSLHEFGQGLRTIEIGKSGGCKSARYFNEWKP